MSIIGIGLLLLILFFLSGVPIAFSFGLVVVIVTTILGYDLSFLLHYSFERMRSLILLAIPFFILTGAIMQAGNITEPIINFVDSIVSRVRGGMGAVGSIAIAIFGAISGSAAAAIACIGSIMIPRLVEEGYPRGYATSLMSAAAGIALLIPPSFSMILYGWLTNSSITACFLAGALPGVLLTAIFIIINRVMVGRYPTVKKPRPWGSPKQVGKDMLNTGWHAIPALMMPVLMLGTIYGGIATPTEASAVAMAYTIPVGFLIYRGLTLKNFGHALINSSTVIGAASLMLFFGLILGRVLATENVPRTISDLLLNTSDNKIIILLMVNAILFLTGMFMDDIIGMTIMSPLLFPVVVRGLGLSPVHFAAIITTNLTMGLITPPMAPLIFLGQLIGKTTFPDMIKTSLLFVFLAYMPVVLIVTYWPPISEWLPVAILGPKILIPPPSGG